MPWGPSCPRLYVTSRSHVKCAETFGLDLTTVRRATRVVAMRIEHRPGPEAVWLPGARALEAARTVAVAQGAIWFMLLSHGGKGLVFGPLAWLAVLIGTRFPGIAGVLLLIPVASLLIGWAPIFSNGSDAGDWLIFGALVVPALAAASVLLLRSATQAVHAISPPR